MQPSLEFQRCLKQVLRSLNDRLATAVQKRVSLQHAASTSDGDSIFSRLGGVYVDPGTILQLLADATPVVQREGELVQLTEALSRESQWAILTSQLKLSPFECDVLLLALAAEIDSKYEKVFGLLNDDVTRKRPNLGLAFELVGGPGAVVECFDSFEVTGKLLRYALIEVLHDENSRLSWPFRLTSGGFRILVEKLGFDPFLQQFSIEKLEVSNDADIEVDFELFRQYLDKKGVRQRQLVVTGPAGVGKTSQIQALSRELGLAYVSIDLKRIEIGGIETARLTGRILARDAHLKPVLLHLVASDVNHLAAILGTRGSLAKQLGTEPESDSKNNYSTDAIVELRRSFRDLPSHALIIVEATVPYELACQLSRLDTDYQVIGIQVPSLMLRRQVWKEQLISHGWPDASATKEAAILAPAFRFGFGSIKSSVHEAAIAGDGRSYLWRAARSRAAGQLEGLAERVEPKAAWSDLVVSNVEKDQLLDLVRRVRYWNTVIDDWGFDKKLGHGKGVNALFAGPPGTGKTMAAEVLANELGIPIFRVDCSSVVSKYIGETEKNLERIFKAAETSDALIFFDEADALFGKRTQVTDAHDRYANIETSYLLQRIERHEGLVVLATNISNNIDSAFIRRLAQLIHFRQPDAASRLQIWKQIWPSEVPLSEEVETSFGLIAKRFDVNGGTIKNAALTAAYLAAESGTVDSDAAVQLEHIIAALAQEYRKLGKDPERCDWRQSITSATPSLIGGRS